MSLAMWRDISIVWLALQCFVVLIIPLAALYFLVKGMNTLLAKTRPFLLRAQGWSRVARERTGTLTDQVADPLVRTYGQAAKAETVAKKLWQDRA